MAMAKLFMRAPEGRAFLVHVDEDLADAPVLVFAGAEIDLVAADHRLLGVALAAVGQLFALARALDPLDHPLDDLLGDRSGARRRVERRSASRRASSSSSSLSINCEFSGCDSFEPSR